MGNLANLHWNGSSAIIGLMADVTQILSRIENGDPSAAEQLLPLVYSELRKLAAVKIAQEKPGQTLQATALVHEAYLRLVGGGNRNSWDGRGHFFAAAAEAMRRLLVEKARRKRSQKAGDGWHGNWGDEVPPPDQIPPAPGGPPTLKTVDKTAAELLIEMARKYPGELVLHTAGPVTNIALAMRLAPDIVGKIKAVYTMGGHIHVNQRFNFWWDAEAAHMFIRTPWKERHLTPIDVCHKTYMTKEIVEAIASAGTPLAEYMRASYLEMDRGYSYMWDELAAAAIIDPGIITETEQLRLDVDYLPGPSYGKTVWTSDRIEPWFAPQTWTVQTDIDVERFEKLFIELMRRPPAN